MTATRRGVQSALNLLSWSGEHPCRDGTHSRIAPKGGPSLVPLQRYTAPFAAWAGRLLPRSGLGRRAPESHDSYGDERDRRFAALQPAGVPHFEATDK
jgi:hypothetical protein